MNKNIFNETKISPRIVVKKGWAPKNGNKISGIFSNKQFSKNEDKIGEIFVYHKNHPWINNAINPNFEVGTVKLLYFEKGKKCSLHTHVKKSEIFHLVKGNLNLTLIKDGQKETSVLLEGQSCFIRPGMIHQMTGLDEENILLEISTLDEEEDSYRIEKGD